MTSAGDGNPWPCLPWLRTVTPSGWSAGTFGSFLQLARLALIVATPSRCGGQRGWLARRRRRVPEDSHRHTSRSAGLYRC